MKTKILLPIVLIALMVGCSTDFSDDDYLAAPPESFDALMAQGWSAFETENYAIAVETFAAAAERKATLPEVYLGLGWSNIRDLNLENGRIYLGSAISFAFLDTENGEQIILDSKSGLAGIALAEGDYDLAIDYVEEVLSAAPDYAFNHDSNVNLEALKKIRMTAEYYRGDYANAFEEILALGITMENVIRETPDQGSISGLATVDSGFVPVAGDTLTSSWLKIAAPGHDLNVGDYYVITGLGDNGDASLTPLVNKLSNTAGWRVKYLLSGDEILVTSLGAAEAASVSSISLSSPMYIEGTGVATLLDGSALNGVMQVSVYTGRQLVYINSVTTMVPDGAGYSLEQIDEGGTTFQVFGNPLFSNGQRVNVDYYHTDDFGLFLTELIDLVNNVH